MLTNTLGTWIKVLSMPQTGSAKTICLMEPWRQDPREGGHTIQERDTRRGYNGRQGETRPSGRRTHHPTRRGAMGDKRRQDPREGGHTIQERDTRRGTMGDKGRQDPREGGHAIQQEGVQWETRGDKTLGKADTPSNKKGYNGRQHTIQQEGVMGDKRRQDPREGGHTIQERDTRRGTMGDKARQDPREGGHAIQNQGGHLTKALRTPNSTLFGGENVRLNSSSCVSFVLSFFYFSFNVFVCTCFSQHVCTISLHFRHQRIFLYLCFML